MWTAYPPHNRRFDYSSMWSLSSPLPLRQHDFFKLRVQPLIFVISWQLELNPCLRCLCPQLNDIVRKISCKLFAHDDVVHLKDGFNFFRKLRKEMTIGLSTNNWITTLICWTMNKLACLWLTFSIRWKRFWRQSASYLHTTQILVVAKVYFFWTTFNNRGQKFKGQT